MIALYWLLYSTALLLSYPLSIFSPKLRRGLSGRRGLRARIARGRADFSERPIWFHFASSGELEQCLPILDELRKTRPEIPLFLSYFSPSGKHGVELEAKRRARQGRNVPWDHADYSPLDFPWSVKRYLQALKPRAFVAINREIWPGLLRGCRAQAIPCYLFASFFSPHAREWIGIYRRWLPLFRRIGTTESGTRRFLEDVLENAPVEAAGDPRIERVMARREAEHQHFPWTDFFGGQDCLIFASLWPKDFAAIEGALRQLLQRYPGWRMLLVPHEPDEEFVKRLISWFRSEGWPARRWSHWAQEPDLSSHLIIDRVGLLAELYRVGTLVFVGGSFHSRVHNVLEPAAYGLPILTGPLIENSGEAMEMAQRRSGVIRVQDGDEFLRETERLIVDAGLRAALSDRIQSYLLERRGAARRYAEILLEQSPPFTFSEPCRPH